MKQKRYWLRVILFSAIFAFVFIYIVEENTLFEYSFRQEHPYLASLHRVIADVPVFGALILTPSFCKPVITEYGSSSCVKSFKTVSYIIEFLEIVSVITISIWFYMKIKNRNKID